MKNVIDAFFESVHNYPDNTAVMDKNGSYSYAEMDRKSNLLAHCIMEKAKDQGIDIPALRAEGKNGIRIGVLLPRIKEYLIAVIGILRVGCIIVPIDTEYPSARIKFILKDSEADILITNLANANKVDFPSDRICYIEDIDAANAPVPSIQEYNLSDADSEAFLAYTSGSTGNPKGVIHSQKALLSIYYLIPNEYISPECSTCCLAGFTFVASAIDLFPPLVCGSYVYIADEKERKNISQLHDIITRYHIKVMFMPPALYQGLSGVYGANFIDLSIVSGAKLQNSMCDPGRLIEVYGSSETGSPVYHWIRNPDDYKYIGSPAEEIGIFAYIIDEQGNKIEKSGELGELCLVTPYLALGYNKLPEQTAKAFTDCPYQPGKRMFHTGDIASWAENGMLVYHGRQNRMIKLRGFRIELDEIESVMNDLPEVWDCAVVVVKINGTDKIACYYCMKIQAETVNRDYFKSALAEKLSDYMIPEFFIELNKIPRNANGKKDYLKLKSLEIKTSPYIAPRTELEEKLCCAYAVILNIPELHVGIDDDFFAIGGDSISSRQLINYLGLPEITVTILLQKRTPRAIADLYEKIKKTNQRDREKLNQIALTEEIPLTGYQLYFLDYQFYTPISVMSNVGFFCKIGPALDINRFTLAVNTVIKHHPILSSQVIINDNTEFCLKYFPELFTPVYIEEMSEEDFLETKENLNAPFKMVNSKLYVCRIFKTPMGNYFFFDTHHIISDGTSMQVFLGNIKRAYMGENLTPDYFFLFLKEKAQKKQFELETSWKKYISENYEGIEWTTMIEPDHTLRANKEENIRTNLDIPDNTLKTTLEQYKITSSIFFMTATLLSFSRVTSGKNILIRCTFTGRESIEKEAMFGVVATALPIGVQMKEDMTIPELYNLVDRTSKKVQELDDAGFWEFFGEQYGVKEIYCYIYQKDMYNLNADSEFSLEPIALPNHYRAARNFLKVELHEEQGRRFVDVRYMSTRYERKTMELFVREYIGIITRLLYADSDKTVGDILS